MRTEIFSLLVAAVAPAAAQWSCGGTQYTMGSVTFSKECTQAVNSCVQQFQASTSDTSCQSPASIIFMQQQPAGGTDNSHVETAFNDIIDHCLNNGWTTATWYADSQWYWAASESGCYNFTMPGIPEDKTTPTQQRITIHAENAVSIGWNTYEELKQPCVHYGLYPEELVWQECSLSSVTYPTSRTYSNVVTLSNLQPGLQYYYKIASTNSTIHQFLSPRAAGSKEPFNVAVVIDMGVYGQDGFTLASSAKRGEPVPKINPELNHTTIWQLAQSINKYDFVLHPGDFAYADNFAQVIGLQSDPADGYETILEQFYEQLSPISATKMYMAAPGNHDADCMESNNPESSCPVGQTNFTDFVNRWGRMNPSTFPTKSSAVAAQTGNRKAQQLAKAPFWYSFDYGMAHFIMIDTETDYPNPIDASLSENFGFDGQQLEWLKADLASVDRFITPWVILGGHRAWYSTGGSGNICAQCQTAFEGLMYQYGVDLALFGHVHNSQRFLPVYNFTADPKGMNDPKAPMYIVAGGAGNIEGLASIGSNYSTNVFAYADDFSFATLNFLDAQHLKVDFVRSSTGEVLDSSTLFKSHKDRFVNRSLTGKPVCKP
ncbi:hypothetical protein SEPCBS57363_006302 [Sporothrix epigloea]|uniref:Purple acid phosphatase n=1 Tax=Sporothrix epigloea TaxID=1892477 RepID=A0ABP0E5Q5_9PEZI